MKKTAIMKVWSSSEYGGDADFAIVELDPDGNQLTARVGWLGLFGVLGGRTVWQVFLPLVAR